MRETLSFRLFGEKEASLVLREATFSPRRRKNFNLHELSDVVQRFVNAMLPWSYVRPHRHVTPLKTETFVLLKGRVWVILFDDEGHMTDAILMDGKRVWIVDVPPGSWHTLIPVTTSLTFEVKPGPYDPATDKEFASWAPAEGEGSVDLLRSWVQKARRLVREKAAAGHTTRRAYRLSRGM